MAAVMITDRARTSPEARHRHRPPPARAAPRRRPGPRPEGPAGHAGLGRHVPASAPRRPRRGGGGRVRGGTGGRRARERPLAAPERGPSVTRYVVHGGDTLWSAAHHLAPDADPREVVDALIEARGDGALMPGEVLRWQR